MVCRQQWNSPVSLPNRLGQGAILLSLLVALTGVTLCRVSAASPPVPVPPLALPEPPRLPSFTQDIQPIFNQRCIACHGCLGSPCNLKLDSFEGAARGGFGINPYATHLTDVPRTDMDAAGSLNEWRSRGFYPVLGQGDSPQERLASSLMVRLLAAGMASNQPGFPREALAAVAARPDAQVCPATPEALETQLALNPARGMPLGLPAIDGQSFETLSRWISAGAPGPTAAERQAMEKLAAPVVVADWEAFFNAADGRGRLVSRFIFEHVFLATLVLAESPGERFRLVRSSTPPGQPIKVIGTGLPYDDPDAYAGIGQFWYRLQKVTRAPVQKDHFVWHLKRADIDHLRTLFLGADGKGASWDPTAPLEPPWGVGNPFQIFQAIPAAARARFLLENAELIVSGITYGPVCLGQVATFAVKDHFWVWFLDPAADPTVQNPKLGLDTWDLLMSRTVAGDAAFEEAYGKALARLRSKGWTLDAIWDGDGHNPNAWLTVMRHDTNVSVIQGRQGGIPSTYWLLDYAGFERMYYNTVAGFAYWQGDLGKLRTLLFFNFLRQEFEDNFLLLLPPGDRQRVRHRWAQGIGSPALALVPFAGEKLPTGTPSPPVASGSDPVNAKWGAAIDPVAVVVSAIAAHLGPAIAGPSDRLNPDTRPQVDLQAPLTSQDGWERAIASLTVVRGQAFARYLPSATVVRLRQGEEAWVYSLIANRVYKSQYTLVFADSEPLYDEFSLSVYPNLVNGFPNLFIDLNMDQAADFLTGLSKVSTASDWEAFKARYGTLRNSERFWPLYDWIVAWNFRERGVEAGYLDLTYYDLP